MLKKSMLVPLALVLAAVTVVQTADAQPFAYNGEIAISGATLFRDFFAAPASTNDYIDADNDGFAEELGTWPPDQLAVSFVPGNPLSSHWIVQYRGVGSVNGLGEFLRSQACNTVAVTEPDPGRFNRFLYGDKNAGYPWGGPYADASGTPKTPDQIDLAVLDVPTGWAVQGVAGTPAWNLKPASPGYGANPITSSTGYLSNLESLTVTCPDLSTVTFDTNIAAPTAWTIFDTEVAWVAIAFTANRGTGLSQVNATEIQHLFASGRMPSGENLVGATRSIGSGTRNGAMNTCGIDPSWGRGDNIGDEKNGSSFFVLGPGKQPTNAHSSGQIMGVVRDWRLAVGYAGVSGSSDGAAEFDARGGKYEVLDMIFDDRGGTLPVRPSKDTVLDNSDPNSGWQIGGPETFASVGNPNETDPASPACMSDQHVADYLINITASVAAFVSAPANPANDGMPGEYLATKFFLSRGVDALPDFVNNDPQTFVPQPPAMFNQTLQDYIRANNTLNVPAFGSVNKAGLVPNRAINPDFGDGNNRYSDGSTTGEYCYAVPPASVAKIAKGLKLSQSNDLSADFNQDNVRNVNDAAEMVKAFYTPRAWSLAQGIRGGVPGDMSTDTIIPEIIGDFNGDGDFSKEDLRYFADGLAMDPVTGQLNRKAGAIAVDNAILAFAPSGAAPKTEWLPWNATPSAGRLLVPNAADACGEPTHTLPQNVNDSADPFLATGAAYAAGDFRGDVAGSTPVPGAWPLGWDGRVDDQDIDYVCANFGVWSNLNDASTMDLSADMDGDLDVDMDDVTELVVGILKTQFGDVDLDGDVDTDDQNIVIANQGLQGGWAMGDMNCDGVIDAADLAFFAPVPTEVELAAMDPWRSCKLHGTGTPSPANDPRELYIAMIPAAAPGSETVETRLGGLTTVKVVFDGALSAAAPANYSPGQVVITPALAYSESIGTTNVANDTLIIELAGSTDLKCHMIDVTNSILAWKAGATGKSCKVRVQFGNVSGDASTNLTDAANTKARNSATPIVQGLNVPFDVSLDGFINLTDVANVKAKNSGQTTTACP